MFEVVDTLHDQGSIALKALWPKGDEAVLADGLRGEFGVLASLHHPRLCRVFDFGRLPAEAALDGAPCGQGGFFFTRELVVGEDLECRATRHQRDVAVVCQLFASAARGLEVLHAAGIRHGDFKPANAISGDDGNVRLIDFGLAVAEARNHSAGTLGFMAPEILMRGEVDRRADIYAFGISLYSALTGEKPSGTLRGTELISWHMARVRPSVRERHSHIPVGLDQLCSKLMAWSPEERLPTAAEVAAALDRFSGKGKGAPAPHRELFVAPHRTMPQVAELERVFAKRSGGGGGSALALVAGDAGSGKSTVLTEMSWRAELAGAEVVRGCAAVEGRALGGFGAALDQIASLRGSRVPQLGRATTLGRHPFAALANWLAEATRQWPLLIVLDDFDFAAKTTRDLARYLAFGLPDEARLLIVGATQELGTADSRRVGDLPRISMTPLIRSDIGAMLQRASGRRDDRLAGRIFEHTRGNLLHVVQSLQVLSDDGFPAANLAVQCPLPLRLEEEQRAILDNASDETRRICHACSILVRTTAPEVVADVAECSVAAVRAAQEQSLLLRRDRNGHVGLARPALGAALLTQLEPARRQALHALAAAALDTHEQRGAADPERITHSMRAGTDCAEAVGSEHILTALRTLRNAGDHHGAMVLARSAIALLPSARMSDELAIVVGELSQATGDFESARAVLEPLAARGVRHAKHLLACAKEENGDFSAAEVTWRELLDGQIFGDEADESKAGDQGEDFVARAASSLARCYIKRGRATDALAAAEQALARVRQPEERRSLEVAACFARGMLDLDCEAPDHLVTLAEAALEHSDPALAATAFNYGALLQFRSADYRATRSGYDRALAAAVLAGDHVRVATLRMNIASLAFHQGDYAACLEQHVAALSLLSSIHANTALAIGRRNLAHLFIELGQYQQGRAELLAARGDAKLAELPLHVAAIDALLGIASARSQDGGPWRMDLECAVAAFGELGDRQRQLETWIDITELELERGDHVAAAAAASRCEALGVATAGRGRRARWLAACAELAAHRGDEIAARAALDELTDDMRDLSSQQAYHALWSLRAAEARVLEAVGDSAAASAARARAIELVERMARGLPESQRVSFVQEPRRRALFSRPATTTQGRATAGEHQQIAHSNTLPVSRLTATRETDRLHRLLAIYRQMSRERDVSRLLELIMETAVELSGAERGFLLLANATGELHVAASRNLAPATLRAMAEVDGDPSRVSVHEVPYSRTVAEEVHRSGELVLSNAPRVDPRFGEAASVHALQIESVVCMPVAQGERVAGVLYLESRLRSSRFSESDARLLMAFADQVAIVLDGARLLEDNRRRARELERIRLANEELLTERAQLLARRNQQLSAARRDLAGVRRRFLGDRGAFGLLGRSPAMERVFQLIDRLAATEVPVMVLGESGTGKELVARALHEYGPRKDAPMVAINCGALPEELLASELFGHERGAFTGATKDRAGIFETATGGTLFLDELGDMPMRMQGTLLRAVQEGVIRRVGGTADIRVDVRIVAATNRDLLDMIAAGTFREDLYYRLHVVPIELPSLRNRAADIPLLAEHFLDLACERAGLRSKKIAAAAMRALAVRPWPGNVRQLEHAMTNAAVLSDGDVLTTEDFDATIGMAPAAMNVASSARRADSERQRIIDALDSCAWNKSKAARLLQIPRRTFYRRLRDFDIK